MTEFIDISYSQSPNINFAQVKASGRVASYMKASGGQKQLGLYVDSKYRNFVTNARAAGLGVGHYFFNGDAATPTQCANFFLANLQGYTPNDGLALDIEGDGTQAQWNPTKAYEFLSRVKTILGRVPDLYLNKSTTNGYDWSACKALGARLWLAYPGVTPTNLKYWGTPSTHQYSIQSVPGAGVVDVDTTIGSATWNNVVAPQPALLNIWTDWSKL